MNTHTPYPDYDLEGIKSDEKTLQKKNCMRCTITLQIEFHTRAIFIDMMTDMCVVYAHLTFLSHHTCPACGNFWGRMSDPM